MERQRSFSFKPTRFLFFVFTIFSAIIFLCFFSISITTIVPLNAGVRYSKPLVNFPPKPVSVETLSGFNGTNSGDDVKKPIIVDAHLSKQEDASGSARISVLGGIQKGENESEVSGEDTSKNGAVQEDASGSARISVLDGIQRGENESEVSGEDTRKNGAVQGNFATGKEGVSTTTSAEKIEVHTDQKIEEKKSRECDVWRGKWVFDESYPLYTNQSCPFIDEGFDCGGNGRLDKDYMKWRWQPRDCDIPRFNASRMLELIRGKRLVFVGDSINRNQWESMMCLLFGGVKDPKKVYETHGRKITKEKGNYCFKFVDYKCTVEFYVSHFLVHEGKARLGRKRVQTLRIDSIDRGSSRWRGADILIFNSAHWWSHFKTKAGVNYYQEGDIVHARLDVMTAFRRALTTWASWVDKHIKPGKTRVFFRSSAPSHFRGGQWNSGGHCKEATQPLNGTFNFDYPEKSIIAEEVIKLMKTPVTFLNITGLSQYRRDGHPSVFGRKPVKAYSSGVQDCSHWCLPGVPDAWNQLLYYHLQSTRTKRFRE